MLDFQGTLKALHSLIGREAAIVPVAAIAPDEEPLLFGVYGVLEYLEEMGDNERSDCLLHVHAVTDRDTEVCALVLDPGKVVEAQWKDDGDTLVIYTRAGSIEIQATDTDETPAQPS